MKTISKKLYFVIALGLTATLITFTGTQSMAVSGTERTSSAACTRIATLLSTSNATVATHIASMKTDFANRISNIASRQADVDQQSATFRASIADKFDAKITKLREQANLTTAQIAAIDTYATNMKTAESTRETSVDAARLTYRTALSGVVNTHQQSLINATSTFEGSISEAFTIAQTNCSNGTAMATLKQTISTARQTFKLAQQSSVGDSIKQLATTRNTAIKAADTAFAKSAADYTAILVTSLG
jgi:hypothetical protein